MITSQFTGCVPDAHYWLMSSSACYDPQVLSSIVALQVVRFQPVLLPGAFPSQVHGFVCSLVEFLQGFVSLLFLPEWVPLKWQSCP